MVKSLSCSSVGILQARILEWDAMFSPRVSSQPRGQTCVSDISCIGKQVLYHSTSWEAPISLLTGCVTPHWIQFFQFQSVTRNILPIKIIHFASKHVLYKWHEWPTSDTTSRHNVTTSDTRVGQAPEVNGGILGMLCVYRFDAGLAATK